MKIQWSFNLNKSKIGFNYWRREGNTLSTKRTKRNLLNSVLTFKSAPRIVISLESYKFVIISVNNPENVKVLGILFSFL